MKEYQRLDEEFIQKRIEFVKSNLQDLVGIDENLEARFENVVVKKITFLLLVEKEKKN